MGTYYVAGIPYSDELYHHGIKGQKWGNRRFQNEDGSLTPEGMRRYNVASNIQRDLNRLDKQIAYSKGDANKLARKAIKLEKKHDEYMAKQKDEKKRQTREQKDAEKMTELTNKLNAVGSRMNEAKKRQEGLQWAALGRGMNISTSSITRNSTRPGERVAKHALAVAGALSMSAVTGGIGVWYGGSVGRVQGTKYNVHKSK